MRRRYPLRRLHTMGRMQAPMVSLPLAFGRHLLFREISKGGWIAIIAVIAIVLLLVFWPRLIDWIERHRRVR